MKQRIRAQSGRTVRTMTANSVSILKPQNSRESDTALEIVDVYEAVERTYRAAVMAGEQTGVAYSTNY